jgi:hypothetical protein
VIISKNSGGSIWSWRERVILFDAPKGWLDGNRKTRLRENF